MRCSFRSIPALVGALGLLLLNTPESVAAGDQRLIEAVRGRSVSIVRALLKQGADVNLSQADGATALLVAALNDDAELAALLLKAGARVNAANDYGVTPLSAAAGNGSAAMVGRLLAAGAPATSALPTGETALMTASRVGAAEPVRLLLDHGARTDAREPAQGQTALMWAVAESHLEVARLLLATGADVNARSNTGFAPIMFAARQGSLPLVTLLLDAGAKVNDADNAGVSVLMVATVRGHAELATYLLSRGADPNVNTTGYTPLHWASAYVQINEYPYNFGRTWNEWSVLGGIPHGRLDLVRALLAHGADPNAVITREGRSPNQCDAGCSLPRFSNEGGPYGRPGSTPFLIAAANADLETMTLLLKHEANPRVRDGQNTTALMLAVGQPFEHAQDPIPQSVAVKAVQYVLSVGADVNEANTNYGDTALHLAAYLGYEQVVQLLLEGGADVNAKNKAGWTPLKVTEGGVGHNGLEYAAQPKAADVLRRAGGVK